MPLLLLAAPPLLGIAITSAANGNEDGAIRAFYGLFFAVLLAGTIRNFGKEKELNVDEVACHGWLMLNQYGTGPWLGAGAGTAAYLENMMRKGVMVPLVVLDLCAALRARVVA